MIRITLYICRTWLSVLLSTFARVVDASTVGLSDFADIDGLKAVNTKTFYLLFARNDSVGGTTLPDTTVALDEDVVLYDSSSNSWTLFFKDSNHDFNTSNHDQDINALDVHSGPNQ